VNDLTKNILVFIVIIVVLLSVVQGLSGVSGAQPQARDYSEFLTEVRNGEVSLVEFEGQRVRFGQREPLPYYTISPETDNSPLIGMLEKNGIRFSASEPKQQSLIGQLLISSFPILLLIGVWIYFMRQMQGGGGKAMGFGKSKARLMTEKQGRVTFEDVAGVDEAKEELEEIVEFLKDPQKFQRLGGRIPKGCLLVGSPGTGKTLIARAVAGEANVPFFTISGSDFVEMFVGVGASRVRDMFEQGKKNAPCIIFIDEIDAVGRHRGAGLGGGNDEREQTLNQLLVEMDGFEANEGVILIAATNRPDVLDPALLRPGRFDRQVVVPNPDVLGREQILKVHMKKVPLAPDVEPRTIARGTPGFSGADLANLVNEGAILAARRNKTEIGPEELLESVDRVTMGPERRTRVISQREKEIVAYHEGGHALVGHLLEHADPVAKISIVSRGMAAGYTKSLPEEDRMFATKPQLMDNIAMALGGRVAEELTFGEVTTGAANDLERVTALAKAMVTRYAMGSELPPRTFGRREEMVFLGREISEQRDYSEKVAQEIDEAVQHIILDAYSRCKHLLGTNAAKLTQIARFLMTHETVEGDELAELFESEAPPLGEAVTAGA
jgi:cell division protease FtsH